MPHPTHILTYLADRPWACYPDTMQQLLAIALREQGDIAQAAQIRETRQQRLYAVLAQDGRPLDQSTHVVIRDGVAILPIEGPIFRYADWFTEVSGGATIDTLARDFALALAAPSVHTILLHIDSPGGETNGIAQFAAQIAAAEKPVIAFGSGMVASAAYWLASAADEIVTDSTTMTGSIGTVMIMPNPEMRSSRDIEIVSSRAPYKRPDIRTESGRDYVQQLVDAMTDVFVADVAQYRGVTVETVYTDFGQGGVLVGQYAQDAGMVDRIDTLERTLTRVRDHRAPQKGFFAMAGLTVTSDTTILHELLEQPVGLQALQDENETLKARLQDLEMQHQQAKDAEAKTHAAAFAERLIREQRFTPACRADLEMLATSLTPDQFAAFDRLCQAQPVHDRTQEQVVSTVLPLDRAPAPNDREVAKQQVRAYLNGAGRK